MNRTMADGTVLDNLPLDVQLIMVYRNGKWPADPAAVAKKYPGDKYATVWVDVLNAAPETTAVLDVETGDASPEDAPEWITKRKAAIKSSLPTIYCDRAAMAEVIYECAVMNLYAGADYQLIISTLDGTQTINGRALQTIPGVVACQYQGGISAKYDLSVVYDSAWHPLT